jgi:hypothetical protein
MYSKVLSIYSIEICGGSSFGALKDIAGVCCKYLRVHNDFMLHSQIKNRPLMHQMKLDPIFLGQQQQKKFTDNFAISFLSKRKLECDFGDR